MSLSFLETDRNFIPQKNISFPIQTPSSVKKKDRVRSREDMKTIFSVPMSKYFSLFRNHLSEIDFLNRDYVVFVRNVRCKDEYIRLFKGEMKKDKAVKRFFKESFPLEFRFDSDDADLFPAERFDVPFEKLCHIYEASYLQRDGTYDFYSAEDRNFSMLQVIKSHYRHTKSEKEIDEFFSNKKIAKIQKDSLIRRIDSAQKRLDSLQKDQASLISREEKELYPHEWVSDEKARGILLRRFMKSLKPSRKKMISESEFRSFLEESAEKDIRREIAGLQTKIKALQGTLRRIEKIDADY